VVCGEEEEAHTAHALPPGEQSQAMGVRRGAVKDGRHAAWDGHSL